MNSIPLKLPSAQQHERLFLDDAIRRYKAKIMSAADFILTLTNIYRPKGQKLNIPSAKSFYQHFKIPKSTFYRALKKLESLPELGFHWEPTGGISLWCSSDTEDTTIATVPPTEKPKYLHLKQLPKALRNEFEAFVKSQWRQIQGEEIRSFHRFMEKSADFQDWWLKFQQHKTEPTAPLITEVSPLITETQHRAFAPIPDRFKGLFGKKPT